MHCTTASCCAFQSTSATLPQPATPATRPCHPPPALPPCPGTWTCWAARTRQPGRSGSSAWDRWVRRAAAAAPWRLPLPCMICSNRQSRLMSHCHGRPHSSACTCIHAGARHTHPPSWAASPQAANVPKLFRHSGRIRNKHLSKRDTEKLVKEIWRERMNDPGGWAGGGELGA